MSVPTPTEKWTSPITRHDVLGWLMADPEEIAAEQERDREEHKKCLEKVAVLEERIERRGKLIAAMAELRNQLRE